MKRFLFTMILAVCMIACAPALGDAAHSDIESIVDDYKHWTRLTTEPRNVMFDLMVMCRLATEEELAFLDSVHAERYTHVYVSEPGAATIVQDRERTFPVGSVIVKEKLVNANDAVPEALGIMIKRESGFNPQGGDWEYVYREKDGRIARGPEQLGHCQACHVRQSAMDSVFWPQPFPKQ